MIYLNSYKTYNDELLLEKINFNNIINKLKDTKNFLTKRNIAHIIAITLLSLYPTNQAINFVKYNINLNIEDKEIVIDVIEKEKTNNLKDPTELKLSRNGMDHIKDHEELKLKAYKIGDGKITIGYGHAEPIKKSKYKLGQKITLDEAEKLLWLDATTAANGVRRMFERWKNEGIEIKVSQSQFDAMVSMAYNMGVSGLLRSEFVKLLKQNELNKAAEKIKTTGINKKFPGLSKRRIKEYDMFMSLENELLLH
jgi:lysozyme